MKAADYIKSKGVKSIKTLAHHYGFHPDTLGRWYNDEKAKVDKLDPLIERYLEKVVEAK